MECIWCTDCELSFGDDEPNCPHCGGCDQGWFDYPHDEDDEDDEDDNGDS